MKLIIDIDEELYKNVIEDTRNGYLGSDVWKSVANGTPISNEGDLISRSDLKKTVNDFFDNHFKGLVSNELITYAKAVDNAIDNATTVELTEEQAIDKLHETGWLIRHDKEMTERPHIIDNCDMNVFEPEKYMEGGAEE